ncbi:DUF3500 domain-containing protein [Streptomyces sp. NPDC005492]|uniref:DUF3500 domain-containing protein n=1 Tax=Streptomyces sp. NPDC005492 TaxID=3156883 RepID=UPI0033A31BF1
MPYEDWPSGLRNRSGLSSRVRTVAQPNIVRDRERLEAASHEPFRGVTTSAGPVAGLFDRTRGTADLSAVDGAARTYLDALSDGQRQVTRFPLDDPSRRQWANPSVNLLRHGLLLEDLDATARDRALDVVRESLSESGFQAVLNCMRLNRTIGEIRDEVADLNELMYWFSLYGEPAPSSPWGWQLDGHHVNVNCTVVDGRLVTTPTFLGAEPVAAFDGTFVGTWALQAEQDTGSALYKSLTDVQRAAATLHTDMPPDLFTGAGRDNYELDYQGAPFSTFTPRQLALALDLIAVYVGRERKESAEARMVEVVDHLSETHFAWVGHPNPDGVFYYRVHSPVILIEFEHSRGIMFDNDHHARNHIHTIVRTPNGNDYGQDYLRQHHERFHAGT